MQIISLWPAPHLGSKGWDGDTKARLGPGGAGMFGLVGEIKLAFLDQRCRHTSICQLVLAVLGREYSRDVGEGFKKDMSLKFVLEGSHAVLYRRRKNLREGVFVYVHALIHTRSHMDLQASRELSQEKERRNIYCVKLSARHSSNSDLV